jgi:hypothetical protein
MQSSRWCIGYDRAANDARPRWINATRRYGGNSRSTGFSSEPHLNGRSVFAGIRQCSPLVSPASIMASDSWIVWSGWVHTVAVTLTYRCMRCNSNCQPLIGVFIGALASYLTGTAAERALAARRPRVRWDTKQMEVYASYGLSVKRLISIANRLSAGFNLGPKGPAASS